MDVVNWEPAPRRFLLWTSERGIDDPTAYGVTFNHGPTFISTYPPIGTGRPKMLLFGTFRDAEDGLAEIPGDLEWLDGWYPAASIEIERFTAWVRR